MLDKKVFKEQVSKLLMAFPCWSPKLEEKEVAEVWYDCLSYMDDERFIRAIKHVMQNEKFYPSIAKIVEAYTEEMFYGNKITTDGAIYT